MKNNFSAALRLTALPFLCVLLSGATANAQDAGGNPANWCRNGAFASDAKEFKVARVRGSRAYFYGEDEGCPGPDAKCRRKAYVVAGNALVVSRRFGDYVCAWFQPARGYETVGWLRADQLELSAADASPPAARWLGEWTLHSNGLTIRRGAKAGELRVEGQASWYGVNPGNVHVGEVNASAAPDGNTLTLEDDICKLTLRLVGDFLLADDNGDCGGVNVTFDGVYRKKK